MSDVLLEEFPDSPVPKPTDEPSSATPLLTPATADETARRHGFNLFLVGFLVLFLELACIRWFAANVIFLQFFTNLVLIACFLGMSCGCLAARRKQDWLARFPALAVVTFMSAVLMFVVYYYWEGLAIDVGSQTSPQRVFFGTESRNPDIAQFVIPIDLIGGVFFVLIALLFVGLGQVLGRAFDAYPNRIVGYTLNIGGSIVGIVGFTLLSFARVPPVVWFSIAFSGVGYLLYQHGRLKLLHAVSLGVLLLAIGISGTHFDNDVEVHWSPYYAISHLKKERGIRVNTIGHQQMVPFDEDGPVYSLIHLLQQHSGGKPFENVLIIGAGTGNDVAHALKFNAGHIDAVEIDPVILEIGRHHHPDRPYDDPRVTVHLDDGRHFLRTTDQKYDLVVYALVDSLILHSTYANIRLESFLFTEQAFEDVRRTLKPDGMFVMYNFYRQGWIVERAANLAEKVFGQQPLIMPIPYREIVAPDDVQDAYTMLIAGANGHIAETFRTKGSFWLHEQPTMNLAIDGFTADRESLPTDPTESRDRWHAVAPAKLVTAGSVSILTSDDWPFFYLRRPMIPTLNIRSMLVLGTLGLGMVLFFLPKGGPRRLNSRMFFLGAAFMLLETKAVVHLALLFGSTWLVNSAVFFAVLIMILLANLYVLKAPNLTLKRHYAGLFLLLAANVLIPLDVFLGGGILWRYVIPCTLVMAPIFFAGVIFARSFRDAKHPDEAFGSNIAGAVVGGLCEAFSMLLGFRYLLLVAVVFYALSTYLRKSQLETFADMPSPGRVGG